MQRGKDFWILAGLFVATSVVAVVAHFTSGSAWLEVFSFITGALCVWLTVKESVWNFPISLINVVAYGFVFFKARLFADAGLQAVYFVLTIQGWYLWLYGGEQHGRLSVSKSPLLELLIVAACGVLLTWGLTLYLRHVNGAVPFWDALTTSLSLCAQYLLNRKYLENWYCWIAADIIYIPVYAYKDLRLTALLYFIFLGMATMGLLEWRTSHRLARQGRQPIEVPAT